MYVAIFLLGFIAGLLGSIYVLLLKIWVRLGDIRRELARSNTQHRR